MLYTEPYWLADSKNQIRCGIRQKINKRAIFEFHMVPFLKIGRTQLFYGKTALGAVSSVLKLRKEIILLCDENSAAYCLPILFKQVPSLKKSLVIILPSGEEYKTLENCSAVWEVLSQHFVTRKGLMIGLGGGVIGDMCGFIAGVYKRGIDYVLIPTTLLAQTDASLGAKTGVDFMGFKNQLGLFAEPLALYTYPGFLNTLTSREYNSGWAEIIKHALIGNARLFNDICKANEKVSEQILLKSISTKVAIVNKDPKEIKLRKLLNFGHSLGHAIESLLLSKPKRKVLHGEAVAAGMVCELYISCKRGYISEPEFKKACEPIHQRFKTVKIKTSEIPTLLAFLLQDKKKENSEFNFTLIKGIGKGITDVAVSAKEIKASISYYRGLHS